MDGLNLQFQCPLAVVVRSVCRSGTATTIPGIRLKKSILLPLVTSLTTSQDGRTRTRTEIGQRRGFRYSPLTQPVANQK